MERNRYDELCRQFAHLARQSPAQRERELEKLRAEDESLAAELTQLFACDEAAEDTGFLDYESITSTQVYEPQETNSAQAELPEHLEGYEIIEQLGGGGMGNVYKARQLLTEKLVALKLIRGDWISQMSDERRQETIRQFHVEAQSAAKLRHPNIVHILHMGETNGQHHYAMDLVDGESLADILKREGPMGNLRAARCVAEVAEAIYDAHQHGILHRDIKPANILYDQFAGAAKIADFGLAELHDGKEQPDSANTRCSRVAGTPPYMAPELFGSDPESTVSCDIYSLGATLYELLTGRPPFEGATRETIISKIVDEPPNPPRKLVPTVSKHLEAICLKCLAKRPEDRYASASDLAQELRAYLDKPKLAAQMATTSRLVMLAAGVILLVNVGVFALLRWAFIEPLAWLLIFCMYPPIFFVVAMTPQRDDPTNRRARWEMWSTWIGKAIAAACIAVGLRIALGAGEPAIQMSYPMFAGLSGMACFVFGASFWRGFYAAAVGYWLLGVLIMLRLDYAPLVYGIYSFVTVTAYGLYLDHLGREFAADGGTASKLVDGEIAT